MKKSFLIVVTGISLLLTGCIKNEIPTFQGAQIEWDAAAWNANTVGLTYPMMTRVPAYGAATTTSSFLINRFSDTIKLRVNLIGPQTDKDRVFTFQFNQAESSANPGLHFSPVTGTGTIVANSSFAIVNFKILNPGSSAAPVTAVLELTDNGILKPAANESKIGLSIAQN